MVQCWVKNLLVPFSFILLFLFLLHLFFFLFIFTFVTFFWKRKITFYFIIEKIIWLFHVTLSLFLTVNTVFSKLKKRSIDSNKTHLSAYKFIPRWHFFALRPFFRLSHTLSTLFHACITCHDWQTSCPCQCQPMQSLILSFKVKQEHKIDWFLVNSNPEFYGCFNLHL